MCTYNVKEKKTSVIYKWNGDEILLKLKIKGRLNVEAGNSPYSIKENPAVTSMRTPFNLEWSGKVCKQNVLQIK